MKRAVGGWLVPVAAVAAVGWAGHAAGPTVADDRRELRVYTVPEAPRPGERLTITVEAERPMRDAPEGRIEDLDVPLRFSLERSRRLATARVELPDRTRSGSYRVVVRAVDTSGDTHRGRGTFRVEPVRRRDDRGPELRVRVNPERPRAGDRVTVTVQSDETLERPPTGRLLGTELRLGFERADSRREYAARTRLPERLRAGTHQLEVEARDRRGETSRVRVPVQVEGSERGSRPLTVTLTFRPETARPGESIQVLARVDEPLRDVPTGEIEGAGIRLEFMRTTSRSVYHARVRLPEGLRPGSYRVTVDARDRDGRTGRGQDVLKVEAPRPAGGAAS